VIGRTLASGAAEAARPRRRIHAFLTPQVRDHLAQESAGSRSGNPIGQGSTPARGSSAWRGRWQKIFHDHRASMLERGYVCSARRKRRLVLPAPRLGRNERWARKPRAHSGRGCETETSDATSSSARRIASTPRLRGQVRARARASERPEAREDRPRVADVDTSAEGRDPHDHSVGTAGLKCAPEIGPR
jgi:hypothetical protein